jgi:Predicted nucleic-acid-binding protein containing a Zn-ribbon
VVEPRTLPAPAPTLTPETEPFWTAAAEGRLLLKRCLACAAVIWYPRSHCPLCGSRETEWFTGSGHGTVYSFTVNHKGEGAYRGAPYVLAYVELVEGPRVLTNIVDVDPAAVTVGMAVQAVFAPTGEGTALVRFAPRREPGGHRTD